MISTLRLSRFSVCKLSICFVILVLFQTANLFAEDYLSSPGFPSFTPMQNVESGAINLANGNIHIDIPVSSAPARGRFDNTQKLVFDGRFWQIMDIGTQKLWEPNSLSPVSIGTPFNNGTGGWRYSRNLSNSLTNDEATLICPIDNQTYTQDSNFTLIREEGTQHHFDVQYSSAATACNMTGNPVGDFATDSSGYRIHTTTATPSGNWQIVSVRTPDGTDLWTNKDSNGNKISSTTGDFFGELIDTLNRTPVIRTSSGSQVFIDVLNSQGIRSRITVNSTDIAVSSNFGVSGVTEWSGTVTVISSIVLPDGNTYQFSYDGYGELASMTLPTGGVISYTYSNFTDAQGHINRWIASRTSANGTWTYSPQVVSACSQSVSTCQQKVTVTKPSGDYVVYTFTVNGGGAWLTQIQYFNSSGTLLLTTTRDYDFSNTCAECNGAPSYVRPIRQTDTIPSAGATLSRKTEYSYDSPQYGNITAKKEWGYYSGTPSVTPDRETDTTFLSSSSYTDTNVNIINKPLSIVVKNASGAQVAKTLLAYDSTPLTSRTGVIQHDDFDFGATHTVRGNLTQIQKWVSGTTYLTTTFNYDTTGQVVQQTDSAGNMTSRSYTDRFYSDNGSNPPTSFTPATATNAYVTSITSPIIGTQTYGYYWGSGKQAVSTDQNGASAYSHYLDAFDRPTLSVGPTGGWSQNVYTSPTLIDVYKGINDATAATSCTSCSHGQKIFDTLGRMTRASLLSDPEGATLTDTSYDSNGRKSSITAPYRSTTEPTYGSTVYSFDGLDRMTQTTRPDGNVVQGTMGTAAGTVAQSCAAATYGVGYPSLNTDESGKKRLTWTDAFGRTIEVDESNASNVPNVATCYRYDSLNNLLQVNQQAQTRTFSYDGLSRIISSTIPENGTMATYYTTTAGTLCSGDPSNMCRQTNARGITTTYAYDALNRLTQKSYSNGTPSITLEYDQTSLWTLGLSNSKGRLTHAAIAGKSERIFSYDAAGNVIMQAECLPSNCGINSYQTFMTYNPAGDLATITYPSGRQVTYTYTNADRVSSVVLTRMNGTTMSYAYASNLKYLANGMRTNLTYNNAIPLALSDTYGYNNRFQPISAKLANSSATFMNHTLSFTDGFGKNNGNVISVLDQLNSARTQAFTYDFLNRLSTASEDRWALSYGYDAYGNLLQQNVTAGSAPALNLTVNGNNQISNTGFTYDADGNLLADGSHTYIYNGADQLASLDSGAATYTYDADGLRVRKDVGSNYTEYIRAGGNLIAERNPSGDWSDYIFLGSRRIALARDYDTSVEIHGTNASTGQYALFFLNNAGGLSGYTVRTGDKLYFTQWQQSGSKGGMFVGFTDGSDTNWGPKDKEGYFLNDDQTQGTTHFRTVDMSAFAGKTVSRLALNSEGDSAAGNWEIDYEQVVLVSTDGTVKGIYTGQPSISISSIETSGSGVTGASSAIGTNRGNGIFPQQTTIYYHSDHIGSSRVITGGYGYPIWQATYLPFGYEYNAQATVSAYKFAGYEHDAESGLENANLRQLSSQLARFTSPDPLSGSISDPQSLNRYAYARNNPLKFVDPSGAFSFLGLLQDIGGAISSGAGAAWGGISSFGGSVWGGISSFGGSVWGGVTDLFGPTPVSNFYDCQDCLITVDVNGNGNPPPPPPPPDVPLENDFLHNNPGCPTCGSTWGNYGQVADAGFWVEFTLASAAAAPLLPTAGEDLVLLDISPNVWQDPFLAPPGWSGEVGQEMPGYRGNENFFDERGEWHFHEPDAWHPDTHWDFKSWDNFNVPNTQQIPTTAFPPRL